MKLFKSMLYAGAATILSTGIACAAGTSELTNGPVSVTVWNGNGISDNAALPAPTSTPLATFTYTGPIDFVNNAPNNGQNTALNTFADFGFSSANISGYSGTKTEANFLATTMSLAGFTYNSYLTFTGSYTASAGTSLSITHDDGASFYTSASTSPAFATTSGPTSEITESGLLPAGTNTFDLVYVESNGSPADLITSIPEPGSLALLGTTLIGLGLVMRRRRKI